MGLTERQKEELREWRALHGYQHIICFKFIDALEAALAEAEREREDLRARLASCGITGFAKESQEQGHGLGERK